jgi:hypothetical protein
MADMTDEYWPEPVYFPQKEDQPALNTNPKPTLTKSANNTTAPPKKKRFWPFSGNPQKSEKPIPTEEQIVKVGPKDPPASPYPLIRMALPFETEEGILQPGIYLLKPDSTTSNDSKADSAFFLLTQRNKTLLRFKTHKVPTQDTNLAIEGTPSPLSKRNPHEPEALKVQIRVSPDKRTLTIIIQQANQTLESPAYPTATDRRQLLTY